MKESELQSKILNALNRLVDCKAINIHGSMFTEKGSPDIIGAYRGRPFGIEVKVNGNDPAPIQTRRMTEWKRAGAFVLVAREDWTIEGFLDGIKYRR